MNPQKKTPPGQIANTRAGKILSSNKPALASRQPSTIQRRQPASAAPVYRPQPLPRVLQAKMRGSAQVPNLSVPSRVAPPVYRPQPLPRVLQTKKDLRASVAAQQQTRQTAPVAPNVYRPQPIPSVLQTKLAASQQLAPGPGNFQSLKRAPETIQRSRAFAMRTPSPHAPLNSRTIQRSHLKRRNFTSQTQTDVPLPKGLGYHRRHIISHHLMKSALEAWADTHKGDQRVQKLSDLLNDMNNYLPNLIPGPGAENSAIGMFTNSAAKKIDYFEAQSSTPQEMQQSLGKYSGFQQATQHSLIDPVLTTFTNDPMVGQSHESAMAFATDLMDSTDFDWPENANPNLFDEWHSAFLGFLSLRSNAQDFSYQGLLIKVGSFLRLTKPT
jgi:hypothetical protein